MLGNGVCPLLVVGQLQAIHRSYARNAEMKVPSLEEFGSVYALKHVTTLVATSLNQATIFSGLPSYSG